MIDDDQVVHEVDLPARPEAVFAMFVDPAQLVRWIGISAQLEPRPGGTFRFEVVPGQYCEGHFIEVDPPSRLVFTWGWTDGSFGLPPGSSQVEVTLQAVPGGTRLRLVHRGLPNEENRLLHDDGWSRFLERLLAAAQGGAGPAYPRETPAGRLQALRGEGSSS